MLPRKPTKKISLSIVVKTDVPPKEWIVPPAPRVGDSHVFLPKVEVN